MEAHSRLAMLLMLKGAQMFKMQFNPTQSVSQLTPLTGADIHQESSITAEEILIMISSWLDIPHHSTRLRTHGEQVGDKMDSLDLLQEIHAVFATIYHLGSIDLNISLTFNQKLLFPSIAINN